MSCFKLKVVHFLKNYSNNRVFLSRNFWLIVALQKFDFLKTNICQRSKASRANLLVLKTSNFRGAFMRLIVPRLKHSIVFSIAIFKNMNARAGDKVRKEFSKVIGDLGLKITVQSNLKVVDYLDVMLNLTTGKYYPFRKPDNDPLYINAKSNHPPSTIRQIPASISTIRLILQPR